MNPDYKVDVDAIKWLNEMRGFKGLTVASPFGEVVATIIRRSLGQLYNQHRDLPKGQWDSLTYIEVLTRKDLATFDFDYLTQLVIQCHDACVRMEIDNGGPHYLKLRFHPRSGREGNFSDRHPTIEDAIVKARTGRYPSTGEAFIVKV